jgi:hypothetical protein
LIVKECEGVIPTDGKGVILILCKGVIFILCVGVILTDGEGMIPPVAFAQEGLQIIRRPPDYNWEIYISGNMVMVTGEYGDDQVINMCAVPGYWLMTVSRVMMEGELAFGRSHQGADDEEEDEHADDATESFNQVHVRNLDSFGRPHPENY